MTALPTGVVTFLMTDVVGSTPLWERAPSLMDATLERHDALMDATVRAHGGLLLRHRGEGDSTFSVFSSTAAALAAATEAQRRLVAEPWNPETPIAVRIGVHCGEVVIRDREYYGRAVNRAARVRGLANAGQVYLTGAAVALADGQLPAGTELLFVRTEVLRGTDTPEEIYELVDPTRPVPRVPEDVAVAQRPLPETIAATVPRYFTGRGELLELLDQARTEALAEPRVVLLGGEPGAGKSSIAAVAATRAHSDGWHVAAGACEEGGRVPYEAMRDAIGQCIDLAPRWLLGEHAAVHGGEIARLTPRLVARLGAVGMNDALDIETTRRLLAEAIVDLLSRLTQLMPLLMVIDDVQWADRNTLQLLDEVVSADIPGLAIVGTYRAGHTDGGDFGGWFERLSRSPRVSALAVGGLAHDEVLELLDRVAGHPLGDVGQRVASLLDDETHGNALFIFELLRHMRETGVVRRGDDGRWQVDEHLDASSMSHGLRAVLMERFGRLGGDALRVLEVASVLGREFDPLDISEVLHIGELAVLDHLELAARSSLLRETDVGCFEFSHAMVQHTLYDNIGRTRRGALHREAAMVLEKSKGDAVSAAAMAHHWMSTGRDDRTEVAMWARRAGVEAMAALAPEDAVVWYQRALTASTDGHQRLGIMIELGAAQRWADSVVFRGTLLAAAALAEHLGDGEAYVRAALANHRGGASRAGEVDQERMAVLRRALEFVGTDDSSERALLLATMAQEDSQGSDIERSIALADEAVGVARRVGDDVTLFQVLLRITEATRIPATLERRLAATKELFDIAERLGDPVQLGFAAVREVRTKYEAAQFDEVDRAFRVMEAFSQLDPFVHHNHHSLRAVRAHITGDLTAAMEYAELARELGGSEPDAPAVYVATTSLVRWDMGTLDEMLPVMERIRRDFPGVTGFRPSVGIAYLSAGRDEEAREILREGVANRFSDHPLNPLWAITISLYATICIEVGDAASAAVLYDVMSPLRGRANSSVVSINGLVTEQLAALAVVMGDLGRAHSDAMEALAQAQQVGARVSSTRVLLTLARWAVAAGEMEMAAQYALEAQSQASELGMRRVHTQASALLATVGREGSTT
jgi:class 3 adenylate cyclase